MPELSSAMPLDEKAIDAAWDTLPIGSTLISRRAFRTAIRALAEEKRP